MPAMAVTAQIDLIERVEQGLLVLLQIPVVGQREALEGGQEAGQVADQAAGLAPGQLGDVGVLLLGQHRAPGGVGVVEGHEAELVGGPDHHLLPHPGQVDAGQGQAEQGLGHEVPVRHYVEGVLEASG